jgi:hypothetical protein
VGFVERCIGTVFTEAEHEVVADDAAGHVAGHEECEPAEHLPFADVRGCAERGADAVGEALVVGHCYDVTRFTKLTSSGTIRSWASSWR